MAWVYLANWLFDTEGSRSRWRAPVQGVRGTLDLRAPRLQGQTIETGPGLFVYATRQRDLGIELGDDLDAELSSAVKTELETDLGVSVAASGLRLIIAELLEEHGDPTGDTRWKPLRLTRDGRSEIHLGGFSPIWRRTASRPDDPVYRNTLAVFREDYRRRRAAGPLDEATQRWTGAMLRKLRLTRAEDLLEPQFVSDGFLPPRTTITESFDTADSDILGPDLTWTEVNGDFDVVGNEVTNTNATDPQNARAEHDLSSDDQYAQLTITALDVASQDRSLGGATRFSSSAETFYKSDYNGFSRPSDRLRIEKSVTGTVTSLVGPDTTGTYAPPEVLKLTADGSSLELLKDGVSRLTATDTAITGNLRCGITAYGGNSVVRGDNFEAADLAAGGGATIPVFRHHYELMAQQ